MPEAPGEESVKTPCKEVMATPGEAVQTSPREARKSLSEEMAEGGERESAVMRAGDVSFQPSEDVQEELLKGGEDNPQEEMMDLIFPPTTGESGGSQRDIREGPTTG